MPHVEPRTVWQYVADELERVLPQPFADACEDALATLCVLRHRAAAEGRVEYATLELACRMLARLWKAQHSTALVARHEESENAEVAFLRYYTERHQ